jgi:outer membrane protein OmpA-like peptidoglycan-associated protein
MKRRIALLLASVTLLFGASASAQKEARFDAQAFRPAAPPRDLVMVQKSEIQGHLSPAGGIFWDVSLNPLAVINQNSGETVKAVAARLQIVGLVSMGLWDIFDVSLAVPVIPWQTGDELHTLGSEGTVKTPALGDLRLSPRIAFPLSNWFGSFNKYAGKINRQDDVKSGFGLALAGDINFPTGNQMAFASDGVMTGGVRLIADYRFGFGLLLATNLGVWIRPDYEFAGTEVGDQAQFGVAAEAYLIQKWGISVIGEVYGYPSLTKFPEDPLQVPAEVLLGLRFQTSNGVTVTVGGSFGAACGWGSPALRFFNGIIVTPKSSREQEEIDRIKQRDKEDPDGDGLIEKADRCPNEAGPPENKGCPDWDGDGDGVVDREDECPDLGASKNGKGGCPLARVVNDEIVIADQVHFALDKDIILDESQVILDDVAMVMINNPEIREVRIEGHTDVRASDAYNMNLSQRRVNSVMNALIARGIDPSRLSAKGYGHTVPIYDDATCNRADEDLSAECLKMTSANRRVVFHILRYGAPQARPLSGVSGGGSVLPYREGVLPKGETVLPKGGSTLPSQGVLKNDSTLGSEGVLQGGGETVLPNAGSGSNLPSNTNVLPRAGTPGAAPPPKTPAPDAAPKPTAPAPEPPPKTAPPPKDAK